MYDYVGITLLHLSSKYEYREKNTRCIVLFLFVLFGDIPDLYYHNYILFYKNLGKERNKNVEFVGIFVVRSIRSPMDFPLSIIILGSSP